jgi:glycerol uptake facilitator-like aquaporin
MFCIYVLQDNGNLGAQNLTPLMLFFVIFGIGACFGWETGYAINLARDFGEYISDVINGVRRANEAQAQDSCLTCSAMAQRSGGLATITSGSPWWRRSSGAHLAGGSMTCLSSQVLTPPRVYVPSFI